MKIAIHLSPEGKETDRIAVSTTQTDKNFKVTPKIGWEKEIEDWINAKYNAELKALEQSLKETTKSGSVGVGGDALKDIESITNALVDKFKSDISPSKKMSREEFVEKDFESAKEDMVKRGNWTGFNREQVIKNYNKNLKAAKEGKAFDNFLFEEVYNNGYIGAQAELNVQGS